MHNEAVQDQLRTLSEDEIAGLSARSSLVDASILKNKAFIARVSVKQK